jgi:NAD+ synthase
MNYTEYLEKFNAADATHETIRWIKNWFEKNGGYSKTAVIGISGGKDSTVAAALCVEALGNDHVLGVLMPNGKQHDIADSYAVVNTLDIQHFNINIAGAYEAICKEVNDYARLTDQCTINLPARLRMSTLYAVSQCIGGRVVNTCNLSEDYIGYSTRWGDSVGDFAPLANFTTDEVIKIGLELGLPEKLVLKTPSDGLCGLTDEEKIKVPYRKINEYIRLGKLNDELAKKTIQNMHEKNLFKLEPIPSFDYFELLNYRKHVI